MECEDCDGRGWRAIGGEAKRCQTCGGTGNTEEE